VKSAPSIQAPPAAPAERATMRDELGRAIEIYPPLIAEPRVPMVVMLHATCMDPAPVCDRLGTAGREGTFLVCPSGNDTCFGAPDWHGTPEAKSAFLDRDLAAVEARYGAYLAPEGGVLVGWSRGAFAARDILYARAAAGAPPRYVAAVFIAAAFVPDPARLRAAGIKRVVLSAGEQDGSRPTMQRARAVLEAAGIEARYVSLGPIGHWLPEDLDTRLLSAMAWARGDRARGS
jgi:predicted esterase